MITEIRTRVGRSRQRHRRSAWRGLSHGSLDTRLPVLLVLLPVAGAHAQSVDLPSGGGHTYVGGAQIEVLATPDPNIELSLRSSYYNGTIEGGVIEPGVQFRLNKFLTIGPSYFQLFQPATRLTPDPEDRRVRLSVYAETELGRFKLTHRALIEYRFSGTGESWRYRPQFQIETALNLGSRRITPYFAVEPIYDSSQGRWTGNQSYTGVRISVGKSAEVSIAEYHLDQFRGAGTDAVTLGLQYRLGK